MMRYTGSRRFKVPRHAVLAIGLVVFALVLVFDLRQILPLASLYLLAWSAILLLGPETEAGTTLDPSLLLMVRPGGLLHSTLLIPPSALIIGALTLAGAFGAQFICAPRIENQTSQGYTTLGGQYAQ